MLEKTFQSKLIKKIKKRFLGCEILKNDSSYIQGIPDLLILFKNKWAMLECKKSLEANQQPNQKYYINKFNDMSYANFIDPDTQEDVLNEMECIFKS